MLELIGFCSLAIILIIWANSRLKSGKDYRTPLIAGIIIYGLSIVGTLAEGGTPVANIVAIVLLVIAYFVLSGKVKQ